VSDFLIYTGCPSLLRGGGDKNARRIAMSKTLGKDYLEHRETNVRIILRRKLKKCVVEG
jgi:hypothetical protein